MSTRPEIAGEVRRWVEKADNDFRNAEVRADAERELPFRHRFLSLPAMC